MFGILPALPQPGPTAPSAGCAPVEDSPSPRKARRAVVTTGRTREVTPLSLLFTSGERGIRARVGRRYRTAPES